MPSCPRCGYDQSGEIARWDDRTLPPTPRGTCVECGLEFEWIDVLDPDRRTLSGFFEHSRGFIHFFASAWQTWSWTVLPWRFWSRVQMHHEVRVKRAMVWVLVLWISVLSPVHAAEFAARAFQRRYVATTLNSVGTNASSSGSQSRPSNTSLWSHLKPLELVDLCWPLMQFNDAAASQGVRQGRWNWNTWAVYPPIVVRMPLGIIDVIVMSVGFPLMLAVLPHTRARAKIRPAHVLRATGFGMAWLGAGIVLLTADALDNLIAEIIGRSRFVTSAPLSERFAADWLVYILVWVATWWYFALARGFKIDSPRLVWFASAIPTILLVAIVDLYWNWLFKVY